MNDICVSDLHKYFSAEFCDSEHTNDVTLEAVKDVFRKNTMTF